jgi:hypothetical protein
MVSLRMGWMANGKCLSRLKKIKRFLIAET